MGKTPTSEDGLVRKLARSWLMLATNLCLDWLLVKGSLGTRDQWLPYLSVHIFSIDTGTRALKSQGFRRYVVLTN